MPPDASAVLFADFGVNPINAGIIHVDPNGVTRVRFKPDQDATQVKAFAISLEREGGVPKREGPIVMIGNA